MSYYVSMTIDTGGEHPYTIGYGEDFTYNLCGMFEEAGFHMRDFNGLTAGQAADVLSRAVEVMERDPERFKAKDSPNGWGTYDQTMPRLRSMLMSWRQHPKAIIEAS